MAVPSCFVHFVRLEGSAVILPRLLRVGVGQRRVQRNHLHANWDHGDDQLVLRRCS